MDNSKALEKKQDEEHQLQILHQGMMLRKKERRKWLFISCVVGVPSFLGLAFNAALVTRVFQSITSMADKMVWAHTFSVVFIGLIIFLVSLSIGCILFVAIKKWRSANQQYKEAKSRHDTYVVLISGGEISLASIKHQQGELSQSHVGQLEVINDG